MKRTTTHLPHHRLPRSRLAVVLALTTTLVPGGCDRPASRSSAASSDTEPQVETTVFGVTPQGDTIHLYTFSNNSGMTVRATDYGGIITSLEVPDRDGHPADVVLGFDSLDGYLGDHPYFGSLIGRYGNRIGGARFTLDDSTYVLAANNGPNHLHGGVNGFNRRIWHAEPFADGSSRGIVLTRTSPDGEEGYPGDLDVRVTYALTDDDELAIDYRATTDKATPVNLTQHSYFNLAGEGSGDILGHVVTINASAFTPVDSTLIPTGEIRPVDGTPFDFREPTTLGARIGDDNRQLGYGPGYDHNFVLDRDGAADGDLVLAATVYEPTSGRVMEVRTTEPGLQLYTGNFLDGTLTGKNGHAYGYRSGFCMETQHFPDSPNEASFPSTILRPGDTYRSRTVYAFSTRAAGSGS